MAKRKALSKRTRFEVFKRDKFTCQYCGRTPPTVVLHCDHVVAVANGGDNDPNNLVTSCFDCNLGKSDRPLTAIIPSRADQLDREMELAEQTDAYNSFLLEQRKKQDRLIRELGSYWYDDFEEPGKFIFGPARVASIKVFLKSLTAAEILEAMDIAQSRMTVYSSNDDKRWRYFCGICWKRIKGDEE